MKEMNLKTQNGITLVILVVTIAIIIILTSIGISTGMKSVKYSRVLNFVSYMQVIQKKVDELVTNNKYTEIGVSAAGKSNVQTILNLAKTNGEIQSADASDYKYFDQSTISSELGIDNIEDEIVINFATREVVSLNGIEYEAKMHYTQYLLPTGQQIIIKSEEQARDLSFELSGNTEGLQTTIQITDISITNGTLSFQEENGAWQVINNYTKQNKTEQVTISKSGKYTFNLTDNVDNSINQTSELVILLGNAPELPQNWNYTKEIYDYSLLVDNETGLIDITKLSTNSAVAKNEEGSSYYWIPRFAYKVEDGNRIIKFIKGTSKIATDNTSIDESFTIPEEFLNTQGVGYFNSTGIWFSTSSNIMDLFN